MTFLAPQFLWIGLGASALVTALHFIVTQQPMSEEFPTARFVPDTPVEAVSQAKKPSDLIILLLRVLAIISIAAAFSRPVISPDRARMVRIILADLSQSSQSISEVRDSVARYAAAGDIIIGFDSATHSLAHPDSIQRLPGRSITGNISGALVSAIRAGTVLRERADSISLIVVSAFPAGSWDAATDTIRALWPGAIKTVRVTPNLSSDSLSRSPVTMKGSADDPLRYSVSLAAKFPHAPNPEIIRLEDSSLSPASGRVVVDWPAHRRPILARSSRVTHHGGLVAGGTVLVAPFSVAWEFAADSLRQAAVIARWEDGSPAAVQRNEGAGCVRSTTIPVSSVGDFVIRSEFVAIVRHLISPCTHQTGYNPLSAAALLRLRGGTAAAPRAAFPNAPERSSPMTPWLLALAFAFLVAEHLARRSKPGRQTIERNAASAAA